MNHTKKWRSALSLLLALLMVAGQFGGVFASSIDDSTNMVDREKPLYVTIGDSMTNGYGLEEEYEETAPTLLDQPYGYDKSGHNGYLEISTRAYPWKVSQKYGWDLIQLATSACRVEDIHYILEYDYEENKNGEYEGDHWTIHELVNRGSRWGGDTSTGKYGVVNAARIHQESVANADVISLSLGNGNLGVFMAGRITNALGVFGATPEGDKVYKFEDAIAPLDEEIQAKLWEMYHALYAELLKYLPEETAEPMFRGMAYTFASFIVNYMGVIDRVVELNPDAEIIILGLMNTLKGAMLEIDEESEPINLGDYMAQIIEPLNCFMTAYPTMKQAQGEFSEAEFIFVEAGAVETIAQTFESLVPAENPTMRDRFIGNVKNNIFGLLSGLPGMSIDSSFKVDNVNVFEAAMSDPMAFAGCVNELGAGKAQGIAMYLAFEKALIASTSEPMTLGSIAGLANIGPELFSGIFVEYENNVKSAIAENAEVYGALAGAVGEDMAGSICQLLYTPDALSSALLNDGTVCGLLNIYTRLMLADGLSAHPSAKGHEQLTEAIIKAYDENYTAFDKTEDGIIHPALDALKKYYLENSSEVNDKIYEYLLNNPKEVIEFIEANQGNTERQMAAIAVLAYMYNYYGGQAAVDALLADPAGTFDMFVDLMMTHGDNAYRLIKTYILAAELEEEDYENAFKFLVEMLKEYGPGIAQGIYDWAEEEGYIAEIKEAVEEFTGLVEDDVKEFIKVVQPKIEKAVKDLKNFVAEKKAEIAELKTKIETEILPKIEELKAEYAEKKAQYDVIMAHIDEYHPEEKAAVIAAIEAEIKALEAEIIANEEINAQVSEAIANISTEIADVEKLIAQLNGKLDEVGTELEKLAVISADLIEAVEKLAKVAIENIDEEAVEAEIMAVLNDLQTAADEMLYTLKEAWTFTELFTGIAASAEKLGNSLLAKAEKYEEVIGEEVGAVITELTKLLDGSTPAATETIKEIIADVKELGGISEELAEEIADVAETVITEAGKLADVIAEELKAAVEKAYTNAVTGEYAYSADSYYVNIGDSITKGSNNYAKKLANELGLDEDFVDLGNAEYRAEDIRYILDENYTPDAYGKAVVKNVEALRKQYITEIEKADIITVGVGNLTPFMMTQVGKDIFGDEYEMDWAKLVGEDHVQYIEMALDEVKAFISQQELPEIPYKDIIDRFVKIDVEELVMTAVESYAYAYVGFAFNYAELVNDIHEINPDAEVVLVGAYNALPTLSVEGIELGEYIDSLVELMDLQFTVYGMITPNTTFVEVNDVAVERPVEDMMDLVLSIAAPELPSLVATLIGAKEAEINPSEAGHEYIKTQILDAISVTYYGLGDVNLDGEVDAKDATQILRYINGKTSVFDTQNKYKAELIRHNADVDYNVGIEAKDATQILRYCNGKTNTIEGRQ